MLSEVQEVKNAKLTSKTTLKYFNGYKTEDIARKLVPGKLYSMRITFPSPFYFNLLGYSKAGVETSTYSTGKFWVRLTQEIKNEPLKLIASYPPLFNGLKNIDIFLEEAVTFLTKNLPDLPEWWHKASNFEMKTGLEAAQVIDGEAISYSFYIHDQYTSCKVLPNIDVIRNVKVTDLVGRSGNSFFALELSIKMMDFVYNEVLNKVEVTGFINVRKAILMDYGQDKTPIEEDIDYKDIKMEEENKEITDNLRLHHYKT